MTLGTMIYLLIIAWILFLKKKTKNIYISLLSFHIFTCLNIEVGYFLKIGDFKLSYNIFTEIVLSIVSLLLIVGRKRMKGFNVFFPAIVTTAIGVIDLSLRPLKKLIVAGETLIDKYWDGWAELSYPAFDSHSLNCLIHYLTFLLILWALSQVLIKEDYLIILKKVGDWSKIAVIAGVIEFVLKNVFISTAFIDVVSAIFGFNSNVFMAMEKRGIFYRLSGLTIEASHFSYAMFIVCILFFTNFCLGQQKRKWVIISFIMTVLSMSFTSLLYLVALVVIYMIAKHKKDIKIGRKGIQIFGAIMIGTGILIVIYNIPVFQNSYFGKRLHELFNDSLLFIDISQARNYTYTSTRIRLVSMISTLRLVIYRPLFGLGIGTTSSHGSFASIVSGLGVLGTFCWLRVLFFNGAKEKFNVYRQAYVVVITIWCFIGLFIGMFWGMLYNAGNYTLLLSFLILLDKDQNFISLFRKQYRLVVK